ncbi:MAG: hypothetical protein GOMPHAMPRED_004634 [Gomphillus americanus]|uniref:Uncharacterized protein n=1 Tax=Gomphillus americanus TaxID=1940652 RepID=A0A8H3IQZ0_9LECA|nr:MAG: hypothetical protein GOMPHAMPRED_004634 [Gomphillus americanus]
MDNNVTPEGKKEGLDKLGLAIEIAKAEGNPDWDDLAIRLGSASASSLKKTWQNLKNSHILRRKGEAGGGDSLSPKPAKVAKAKPKTPRKKAATTTPKTKKNKKIVKEEEEEELLDVDAEYDEEADDADVSAGDGSGVKDEGDGSSKEGGNGSSKEEGAGGVKEEE